MRGPLYAPGLATSAGMGETGRNVRQRMQEPGSVFRSSRPAFLVSCCPYCLSIERDYRSAHWYTLPRFATGGLSHHRRIKRTILRAATVRERTQVLPHRSLGRPTCSQLSGRLTTLPVVLRKSRHRFSYRALPVKVFGRRLAWLLACGVRCRPFVRSSFVGAVGTRSAGVM